MGHMDRMDQKGTSVLENCCRRLQKALETEVVQKKPHGCGVAGRTMLR